MAQVATIARSEGIPTHSPTLRQRYIEGRRVARESLEVRRHVQILISQRAAIGIRLLGCILLAAGRVVRILPGHMQVQVMWKLVAASLTQGRRLHVDPRQIVIALTDFTAAVDCFRLPILAVVQRRCRDPAVTLGYFPLLYRLCRSQGIGARIDCAVPQQSILFRRSCCRWPICKS